MLQKRVKNQVEGLPVLVLFAIGQDHCVDLRVFEGQRGAQGLGIERRHRGIGDDEGRRCRGQRRVSGGVAQQTSANHDGVTALAQIDMDSLRTRGR